MKNSLSKSEIKRLIKVLKECLKSENGDDYMDYEDGGSFWGVGLAVKEAKEHNKEVRFLINKLRHHYETT